MHQLFKKARADYLSKSAQRDFDAALYPNQLCFVLNNDVILCEKAFANVVGMANARARN